MKITLIGHSTVLFEADGQKILTDPYFGLWGNPAYVRIAPPAREANQLLDMDLVLVSHNHWDHTDRSYFRLLSPDIPVVAPASMAWLTRIKGARKVVGMSAWEDRWFGPVQITAVPAAHISRSIGFVIQVEGKQVYFSGDTYYRGFMKEIGSTYSLDAALLPVTTYLISMTMGERGSVRAVQDLNPKLVIPVHLGITPRSAFWRTNQSPDGFRERLRKAGSTVEVKVLQEGESVEI